MATLPLSDSAARSRSSSNLMDLMAGKKVTVRGGFDKDTVSIRISGHPDDLEAGLQVAHLLLTEPLVEEVKAKQWVTLSAQSIEERKVTPTGTAFAKMMEMISPKDEHRLRLLEHEDLARLTVPAAQAWIDRIVREAPIEVAVVGDIDQSRAMDLVRTYIGSLPARSRMSPETLASLRSLDRPVGPMVYDEKIATKTPVAMVMVGCFGPDWTDVEDRRLLNMASRILNTRMVKRIREQEQLVYGIGVRVTPGLAFRGYGTISAGATTEPEKATRLAEVVNEMMVEFATTGPTDEEMQIVRGQISNALDEQMREPSYWEFNVADMTLRDTDLDDVNAGMAPYDAFTAAQVRDAVARYYRDDSRFTVIVRPDTEAQAGAGNGD
jgi:zinc protease